MVENSKIFWKIASRVLLALLFLSAGILHFLRPEPFTEIVPPFLPWPHALVAMSGAAEIAGAVGISTTRWRRPAAYGLILLLLAVFPANIYMAWARLPFPGTEGQPWVLWARLPLQFLLIAWVWVIRK